MILHDHPTTPQLVTPTLGNEVEEATLKHTASLDFPSMDLLSPVGRKAHRRQDGANPMVPTRRASASATLTVTAAASGKEGDHG
jgi:hypothetical protein